MIKKVKVMKRSLCGLTIVVIMCSVVGCSGLEQKQWIYDNLPTLVWHDVSYDAINTEYQRLSAVLTDYANDAIRAYDDETIDNYYGNSFSSSFLRDIDNLATVFGGESYSKTRQKEIYKYRSYCEKVISDLRDDFGDYLSLCDSTLTNADAIESDGELCRWLMSNPTEGAKLSRQARKQVAKDIAICTFQKLLKVKPCISSVNRESSNLWSVRFDNADTQYVKFYSREDGLYDVEYGNGIDFNGNLINGKKLITKW